LGRFKKYLGKTEIEVDGEKFSLGITTKERIAIMATNDIKDTEGKLNKLYEILRKIFVREFPEEPKEEVEEFVGRNLEKIFMELCIAFKWTTREEIERLRETTEKKIKAY